MARILIVDGDALGAMLVRGAAERLKYEVAGMVGTGDDAVAIAGKRRPDLVLMGMELRGEMTGVEAAAEMARLGVPVVFLGACVESDTLADACRAEPYGFLVTPVSDQDLWAAVETALRRSQADRHLARMNGLLAARLEISEALARERVESHIAEVVCQAIYRSHGCTHVRVVLEAPDASLIASSAGDQMVPGAAGAITPDARSWLPLAACMATGQLRVVRNVADDETLGPLGATLADAGVAAVMAAPILHGHHVMGAICIHSAIPGVFGVEEVKLIAAMAGSVAEAVARLRAQVARGRGPGGLVRRDAGSYLHVLGDAPWLVCHLDAQGQCDWLNAAAEAFIPRQGDLGVADRWLAAIHPDDRDALLRQVEAAVVEGLGFDTEYRLSTPNGAWRWIMASFRPLLDPTASFGGLVGYGLDITDRREVERSLRSERIQLRTLIDHLPALIYIKDADSRFVIANKAIAAHMGAGSPDDLIGRSDADFYPPGLADRYRRDERRVIESGVAMVSQEETSLDPSGRERWFLTTKLPLRGVDGNTIGLVGVGTEITDRRSTDERLRILTQAVDQGPVSVVVTDTQGKIEYVNAGFLAITGYSLAEVIGQNPRIVKSGEAPASVYRELWATITNGHIWRGELHNRRKDGTLFWESAIISPVRSSGGRITHFLGVKEEITQRKIAEAELKKAREVARAADRVKTDFLARMSHEIRTPLNGVIGMVGLLEDLSLTPQQRDYIAAVKSSGYSLLSVVNDILDFSKMDAGRVTLESHPFDLRKVISEVCELFVPRAAEKGLSIAMVLADDVPGWVTGDGNRLRQVLLNLVSNAVKFSSIGDVDVRVSPRPSPDGDHLLRFSVRDRGIGIAPEKASQLFQPFVQADPTMSRRFGGTGLGLAIARQLVRLMGGDIGLSSKPGEGAEFWFTVRFGRAEPVPEVIEPGPDRTPAPRRRSARILLAEDNLINRKVAVSILEKLGHHVEVAGDGEAAARAAAAGRFDLVLMDVEMPGTDGFEGTRLIRASLVKDIPVIALTAHAMKADQDRCLAAGMDDFLSKPFQPDQLSAIIEKWTRRRRVRRRP